MRNKDLSTVFLFLREINMKLRFVFRFVAVVTWRTLTRHIISDPVLMIRINMTRTVFWFRSLESIYLFLITG